MGDAISAPAPKPAPKPAPNLGAGRAKDGLFDGFLPRMVTNLVAMAAVAVGTLWLVEQRSVEHAERIDELKAELDILRYERDRMGRLNQELAREVHDAGVASEVARWQLRWTEERLRRKEVELAASQGRVVSPRASRALVRADSPPQAGPGLDLPIRRDLDSLSPAAKIEPLDAGAAAALDANVQRLATGDGDGLSSVGSWPGALDDEAGDLFGDGVADLSATGGVLDPSLFDPIVPGLRPGTSQLARNRAYLEWKTVVSEAVAAECGGRLSDSAARKCGQQVERATFPYAERAVRCLMTGNAVPDYVSVTDLDSLPTHSLPLDRGAIILCDGALTNL